MNQNPSFPRFLGGGLRDSGNIPPVESEPALGSNGGQAPGMTGRGRREQRAEVVCLTAQTS